MRRNGREPITIAEVLGGDADDETKTEGDPPERELHANGDAMNDTTTVADDKDKGPKYKALKLKAHRTTSPKGRTATTTNNFPAGHATDNEVEAGTSQTDSIPQATARELRDSDNGAELDADPRGSRRGRACPSDSEGSRSPSHKRCKRTKLCTVYDPTPAGVPRWAPELPEMTSRAQVRSQNENHPNQPERQLTLEDLSGLHPWAYQSSPANEPEPGSPDMASEYVLASYQRPASEERQSSEADFFHVALECREVRGRNSGSGTDSSEEVETPRVSEPPQQETDTERMIRIEAEAAFDHRIGYLGYTRD